MTSYRGRLEADSQPRLTRREKQVLSYVCDGKSTTDVAETLHMKKRIVEKHVQNIYEKLQVCNGVQAFRRANRLGLLPPYEK